MVSSLLKLLILLAVLMSVESARRKSTEIRVINITTNFNPKLSTFVDFHVTPESKGRSFDMSWNLSVDIPNNFFIGVDMMTRNTETNTTTSIFPYDFDYCRVWDGFMGQGLARIWFNNIKRFGNFPMKCPIAKGYYQLKNAKINNGGLPPITGSFLTKVLLYIKRQNFKDVIADLLMETQIGMH